MSDIRLSVLLPTLGRPEKLAKAVGSLLKNNRDGMPCGTELLIGFQDDDATSFSAVAGTFAVEGIRIFSWPAPLTLARKVNRLAAEARGDILMAFPNDMTMAPGWAQNIIEVVDSHPEPTVFCALDPTMPEFTTLPILRRSMMDAAGFMAAPWFPFWFTDTWWDEIGDMLWAKVAIDVGLQYQDGRGGTTGMRDLLFWARFFERTRGMRVETAEKLGARVSQAVIRQCEMKVAHLVRPEFVKAWEERVEGPPLPRYLEAKRQAEEFLAEIEGRSKVVNAKVMVAVPSTGTWLARTATCVSGLMAYSSLSGVSCGIAAPEGSMITKQRNDIVEMARRTGSDYVLFVDGDMMFPPDALVRLLQHDKDIVGATYCKRVPPYETLGRLFGDKPTDEELGRGGLWEAEFLPTGMLLVRMSVFDRLPWPWFAESYKFPGSTGVEMMKSLLRQFFAHVPPDDVLDSIHGSQLGEWLNTMWRQEGVGVWQYISEDVNFCRNARKNGIQIWCDVGLTFEMRHCGVQEVTTKMPVVEAGKMAAD